MPHALPVTWQGGWNWALSFDDTESTSAADLTDADLADSCPSDPDNLTAPIRKVPAEGIGLEFIFLIRDDEDEYGGVYIRGFASNGPPIFMCAVTVTGGEMTSTTDPVTRSATAVDAFWYANTIVLGDNPAEAVVYDGDGSDERVARLRMDFAGLSYVHCDVNRSTTAAAIAVLMRPY